MKIIKMGVKPEERVYRGTCSNCKTVFECQQHEGTYHVGGQRDGPWLSVPCPVCRKSTNAYERKGGDLVPTRPAEDPGIPARRYDYWNPGLATSGAESFYQR